MVDIKSTIFGHAEFTTFNDTVTALFANWQSANKPHLTGITIGGHPKELIETISESLLDTFRTAPLLDAYDVYQHLMTYWAETMQDDVYLLVQDGWKAVVDGKPNTDLIPQHLIVRRYFSAEAAAIEQLAADRDAISRQMEEMDEEHDGEDGLLADAKNDKGKLTKVSAKARLFELRVENGKLITKQLKVENGKLITQKGVAVPLSTINSQLSTESTDDEERKLLNEYLELIENEATANKKVKDAQKALDAKVAAQYAKLTEAEIKTLVVDDKWLATLAVDVQTELDRVSQALTGRIRQLAERYATPLPVLVDEVSELSAKVDGHLRNMGFM